MNRKKELLKICHEKVNSRIESLQKSMEEIQAAANEETKSSAGDKYETGRAMMHLEKEKLTGQLAEQIKLLEVLNQIEPNQTFEKGGLGAIIYTKQANYFLSVSLGKIMLEGETYFALSVAAPLGQQLLDKKIGDKIQFRNKKISITNIL